MWSCWRRLLDVGTEVLKTHIRLNSLSLSLSLSLPTAYGSGYKALNYWFSAIPVCFPSLDDPELTLKIL